MVKKQYVVKIQRRNLSYDVDWTLFDITRTKKEKSKNDVIRNFVREILKDQSKKVYVPPNIDLLHKKQNKKYLLDI